MYTDNYLFNNNQAHQTRRKCRFCGDKLEWFDCDSESGENLFMCVGCNAQDIIDENGKKKFVELY
jgi:hypothetical protein